MPSTSRIFVFHATPNHFWFLCRRTGNSNSRQPSVHHEAKGVISSVSFFHDEGRLALLTSFSLWLWQVGGRRNFPGREVAFSTAETVSSGGVGSGSVLFTIIVPAPHVICGWHEWMHLFSSDFLIFYFGGVQFSIKMTHPSSVITPGCLKVSEDDQNVSPRARGLRLNETQIHGCGSV